MKKTRRAAIKSNKLQKCNDLRSELEQELIHRRRAVRYVILSGCLLEDFVTLADIEKIEARKLSE